MIRKETPPYVSPLFLTEDEWQAYQKKIYGEWIYKLGFIETTDILIKTEMVLERSTPRNMYKHNVTMLESLKAGDTYRSRLIHLSAEAIAAYLTAKARAPERESVRQMKVISDSQERAVIRPELEDFDPDETIPAPPFPVPNTARIATLPQQFIPKDSYPTTVPVEFRPRQPLSVRYSQITSDIIDLPKKEK